MFGHLLLTIVIGIVVVGQLEAFWPFLGRGRRKQPKKAKAVKKQSQTTAPTKRPPCPACAADQEAQESEVTIPDEPPPNCFMETTNTIFYGKKAAAETILRPRSGTIWQALKALAEGLDIRATARVFDLDPNTVERRLGQAAEHMEAVSAYLIHDLELSQVQVDELWALLGRRDNNEAGAGKQRGQRWVWAGMDPVSKLMLGYVVGDRSQACAQLLIHMIVVLLAPGCAPLFLSDGWGAYGTALLTHFGHWVQMPRRHKRGASPKPRWQPLPELQYAQVVKKRVKGRVVSVTHRVIYGSLEAITTTLTNSVGQVINTAFIERFNGSATLTTGFESAPACARLGTQSDEFG